MLDAAKNLFTGVKLRRNIYVALVTYVLLMMCFYSVCRIAFYLFNASFFPGMTMHRLARIMLGGLKFDLSAILYSNSLLLLLMIVPSLWKFHPNYKKLITWLFIVVNAIALATNVADFVYYQFTLRRTTLSVIGQFEHEQNLTGLFFQFLIDYWYALVFWILIVAALITIARLIRFDGPQVKNKWVFYISSLAMALIVVALFIGGARGGFAHSTRPITLSNAGEYATVPNDINIVLNTPFALMRTAGTTVIGKVHYFASEAALEKVFTPLHLPAADSVFRPRNVVVIILESFSKEFIGTYNKGRAVAGYKGYAPFLDSLIGKSRAYQYSFANGRKSIDAMPSVLSSIPSIEVPYVLSHFSGNKVNSLARMLGEKGYQTAFFHGAPNGSMGFQSFANLSGFNDYYGKTEYNDDRDYDGIWGIWDEKFMQFFADKLGTFRQPFFCALFSVSSHHPYNLPVEYERKFKGGPMIVHRMIEYTDYSLKKFFQSASRMPWFKNTLFVITADHASAQIQYPEYNTAWGYFSIPIFFYKGGSDWSSFKQEIVQQIDIMPTVLGYVNYDKPYIAFGRDIFREDTAPFAFNYVNNTYQAFMGDYLLLFDGKRSIGLYNFKRDLFLKEDLKNKLPDEVARIETKLKALIQQYDNRMVEDNLTVDGPQRLMRR